MAVNFTVDAKALPGHDAASSFPTKQPNGRSHVGQPVPAYRTVLLWVTPQVVIVNVPPNGVAEPKDRENTNREPGKNVLNPVLHEPEVYIPKLPLNSVEYSGAEPLVPTRGSVLGRPRQIGGD